MPKCSENVKRFKALKLISSYEKSFSQTKVAEEMGISQPAVSQALKTPYYQSLLRKRLDKLDPEKIMDSKYILRNVMEDRHLALKDKDFSTALNADKFCGEVIGLVKGTPLVNINMDSTSGKILSNYIDLNDIDE